MLHSINAYERDGFVVVHGMRAVPESPSAYIATFTPAFPYEWLLHPQTGKCIREGYLADTPGEFPALNPKVHGAYARYTYALSLSSAGGPVTAYGSPSESPRFDSLVKYDLDQGGVADRYELPAGRLLVSEPTFVPKEGGGDPARGGQEDEGYILILASDVVADKIDSSRMLVIDAADLGAGPVAQVELPERVPYGLHSEFVPWEGLK